MMLLFCLAAEDEDVVHVNNYDSLVKNGLSDLTQVQIGWDQYRIYVMNDHREKALPEGCCERE